ncbi:MAG: hypothetical protein AAGC85_06315 [Bacteroidota bacterium]
MFTRHGVKRCLLLLWIGILVPTVSLAQSTYSLSLTKNDQLSTVDTLCLDIGINFDTEGKLGTSNLVFSFDTLILKDPVISGPFEGDSLYSPLTLTPHSSGQFSLNIELLESGNGKSIVAADSLSTLSSVCWAVVDTLGDRRVLWEEDQTKATIVYLDDEATRLSPKTFFNYPDSVYKVPVDSAFQFNVFTANLNSDSSITLNWSAINEFNTEEYVVQRSTNGTIFQGVQLVIPASGDSSLQSYEWTDTQALLALVDSSLFYRISQIGSQDDVVFSEVVEVKLKGKNPEDLIPNATFENFFVSPSGEKVNLNWTIRDEKRISYYRINRSEDGVNFSPLTQVMVKNPAGEGTSISYSYTDTTAFQLTDQKTLYFQIAAFADTNEISTSQVESVVKGSEKLFSVTVYPSPISKGGELTLEVDLPLVRTLMVSLYARTGSKVASESFSMAQPARASKLTYTMPENLESGYYILNLSAQGKSYYTINLLVQ